MWPHPLRRLRGDYTAVYAPSSFSDSHLGKKRKTERKKERQKGPDCDSEVTDGAAADGVGRLMLYHSRGHYTLMQLPFASRA